MWQRYVAIGDSSTEGLDDPDGSGGFRGWADRLAEHIARHQGGLEYANLAVRGRATAQIMAEQLPVALSLRPDLVTVVAGMNDLMRPAFDPVAVAAEVGTMFAALVQQGATVLSFTLPDPTPNMPFAWWLRSRVASLNDELLAIGDRVGVIMVDVGGFCHASDPRLWSDDRLHGNDAGHALVAQALAHGLGLPGADASWADPLPAVPPRGLARVSGIS